ncbi:glutaredoxin-like protein NrdH [Acerihabitans sp. TG2]|uniref:glutaredoxin-like protein NrdH n=1 Tax=Acerihabitans sp. TG2 TaxID=3096008 RepID=UPI002B22A351|nr:glutaredoxin-like protein NrdH [Acerihabitans sp. TG2]MEA9391418.1 glutaredoxin-like protein NrdH [Acerihabitans sp. TG2]
MTITVYTKPDCVQCHATCRALTRKGIGYRLVNLLADKQGLEHVKSLGYQQVPVVQTATDHWCGFRPDKINQLADTMMDA